MKLQIGAGPQLPLSERPIQAEVSLQDLFNWHSTAEAQAKAIGAAFVEEDDGPSAEDLLVCMLWPHISPGLAASHQVCIGVGQEHDPDIYSLQGYNIILALEPWHANTKPEAEVFLGICR